MQLGRMFFVVSVAAGAAGCSEDPQYIDPRQSIEVGLDPEDMGMATATLQLPYDAAFLTMDVDYQRDREARLVELNAQLDAAGQPAIALDQLPLVRLDQLDISIEWRITNLSDNPGQARIHLNGANQYFLYVPANFIVVDPNAEEEDPPPPPLAGDIPIDVAAQTSVSGVFREDTLREAALDLELITRGMINPFAALLTIHEDTVLNGTMDLPFVQSDPENPVTPPAALPLGAFGHFVQFDMTLLASQHMVLEYNVRVRDHVGMLHEELLEAPTGELMVFAPVEFVPPPPPAP